MTQAVKVQILAAVLSNNSAAKTIDGKTYAADELFLAEASFTDAGTGGEDLFAATMTIKAKPGGWKDVALNVAYKEIKAGKATRIMKEWDEVKGAWVACSKPWPLNLDGTAKSGSNPVPDSLEFWPYPRHAWTGVPLS